jgi:hypothetical protein
MPIAVDERTGTTEGKKDVAGDGKSLRSTARTYITSLSSWTATPSSPTSHKTISNSPCSAAIHITRESSVSFFSSANIPPPILTQILGSVDEPVLPGYLPLSFSKMGMKSPMQLFLGFRSILILRQQ